MALPASSVPISSPPNTLFMEDTHTKLQDKVSIHIIKWFLRFLSRRSLKPNWLPLLVGLTPFFLDLELQSARHRCLERNFIILCFRMKAPTLPTSSHPARSQQIHLWSAERQSLSSLNQMVPKVPKVEDKNPLH